MKAKITEKENYLMLLRGEQPYWIPQYTFGPMPGAARPCTSILFQLPFIGDFRKHGGGKDVWGVNYVGSDSTMQALLPEPGNFILDDITHWHDVIKAPDLSDIDWEGQVKKGLDELYSMGVKREDSAIEYNMHSGYFQDLVGFMGFENALCAMYEEPEEVAALMNYICDWYTTVEANVIDILKPDVIGLADDISTWRSPFMSEPMYRELFYPCHDREAKFARDRGLPITMHCCGEAMEFIADWVEMGVNAWDPAQLSNDIEAVQKKYGNKLAIMGAWDARGRLIEPDCTDEEIRQSVRDTMDKYAQGGGFGWCGGYLAAKGDVEMNRRNGVLFEEVNSYGDTFYGYSRDIQADFAGYNANATPTVGAGSAMQGSKQ